MRRGLVVLGMLCALFIPSMVLAQGSIGGVVKDTSGAVIPGVTVTATSPALIEGSRAVVTDSAGLYRIVDLRPGTYDVTFMLEGFSAVKREGIVIQADFNATVNADLKVGSLEESITVTGSSPVVDVKSTQQQQVLTRQILDELPAVRVIDRQAQMLPGVLNIVPAGAALTGSGTAQTSIHGSQTGDGKWLINGVPITFGTSAGGSQQALNDAGFEQVSVDDGSGNAESSLGGARFNIIPKEGGNMTSGLVWANWHPNANVFTGTQSDLKALNLSPSKIDYDYDISPAIGGAIKQNKLWYFGAYRKKGTQQTIFNTFTDASGLLPPPSNLLTPGTASNCVAASADCVPLHSKNGWYQVATGRMTYQATMKDKIAFSYEGNGSRPGFGKGGNCSGASSTTAVNACSTLYVNYAYQTNVKWTEVPTNKLLIEAVFGKSYTDGNNGYILRDGVAPYAVSINDTGFGTRTGMPSQSGLNHGWTYLYATTATASYITGSHAFKFGMNLIAGHTRTLRDLGRGNIQEVRMNRGAAVSVLVDNTPFDTANNLNSDLAFFAQDSWTVRRLTLNLGLRYNHFNESIPAQSAPAGNWLPARSFNAVSDVPNWNDFMPRVGLAYDLFGTGKTALKFGADKFVAQEALGLANTFNPLAYQTDTRTWKDLDGNLSPFLPNSYTPNLAEIGPSTVSTFGLASSVPTIAGDLKRPYNWSYSATVQHELLPAVSLNIGYYRRNFYKLYSDFGGNTIKFNNAVSPANYVPFTITAPSNPNLPGGGGQQITLYNYTGVVGASAPVIRNTTNSQHYDGFEVNMRGKLPKGGNIFGGVTWGRTASQFCDVNADPTNYNTANGLPFCNHTTPFREIYKLGWNYNLPWQVGINGTYQQQPGSNVVANYTVTQAIAGIPLTGGVASITVPLMDPTQYFLDDVKTLDLRFTKNFSRGRTKAKAFVDLINSLNFSTILSQGGNNGAYTGANWPAPTAATAARYVRLGVEFDF